MAATTVSTAPASYLADGMICLHQAAHCSLVLCCAYARAPLSVERPAAGSLCPMQVGSAEVLSHFCRPRLLQESASFSL